MGAVTEKVFPFLAWFKFISKDSLKADLSAGLTGAVIVLPQGVAFATIAGLPPEYGLYTAMAYPPFFVVTVIHGTSVIPSPT